MDEKDTKMVEVDNTSSPRQPTTEKSEIQVAPVTDYSAPKAKTEQLEDARGWESENLIQDLEKELEQTGYKKGFFDTEFKNPKHFTWMIVAFASMGGLLSGLDQSLISGANLFLPDDLTPQQNSLVNSGMPLGGKCTARIRKSQTDRISAVAGALLISPCNEYFGRRWAILISCILYTIGGALEAGSINYSMIVAARVILGAGVGLEGGTVPVYVAETVESRLRGNLVSLYQFSIALGEVLGYAVAAMFGTKAPVQTACYLHLECH
jgi:hypothetical protein